MTSSPKKIGIALLGSGNIGTDLLYKVDRDDRFELKMMAGIDPLSEGLARAREMGHPTSSDGIDAILECADVDLVFDATSARAHQAHAPRLAQAGVLAVDLTPAKVGPSVVPCVNMERCQHERNVNLISCAAQATVPIVHAVSRVTPVEYAEIVATVSSRSIGPGTRQNIEEFTHTTQRALEEVGGARRGKALVVINPADPPIIMRNTIYTVIGDDADDDAIKASIQRMVEQVREYVPGYTITVEPFRRKDHFMIGVEVTGAGDYLPSYAGNLDIINAAAVAIAGRYAEQNQGA
jgi:acetaldehyde dehydrogenase